MVVIDRRFSHSQRAEKGDTHGGDPHRRPSLWGKGEGIGRGGLPDDESVVLAEVNAIKR
jgi:hypothetical protein